MRRAVCTIASIPWLAHARVVAATLAEHEPDTSCFVLLADQPDTSLAEDEPFAVLSLDEVDHDPSMRFAHRPQDFSYALTPHVLRHLLDQGFGEVVFLKQETMVCAPLSRIWGLLADHSAVLTAHLDAPLAGPDAIERELQVLVSGVHNIGLVAVREDAEARELLGWWAARTTLDCRHEIAAGLHYEQRWLDLVPAFFPGALVARDPALNVGHWSLPDPAIGVIDKALCVGDERIVALRFSGFDPVRPDQPTRYTDRLAQHDLGALAPYFRRYADLLMLHGHEELQAREYGYARFDDGCEIPDVARDVYRSQDHATRQAFGDPFDVARDTSFRSWLRSIDPTEGSPRALPRIWSEIHARRPDLVRAYPDPRGADHEDFVAWTRAFGMAEHQLDECFAIEVPS